MGQKGRGGWHKMTAVAPVLSELDYVTVTEPMYLCTHVHKSGGKVKKGACALADRGCGEYM